MTHKLIAVTPAGRKPYLEILRSYILKDRTIDEWHLWDNCRSENDREYINELQRQHSNVRVVRSSLVDGSNRAINQFYKFATDKEAFYIKLDDDIVYLPDEFGRSLYEAAYAERDNFLYWSPLVINNAICSWLLKYHSRLDIHANLIASAECSDGWRSWRFAEKLHRVFIALCRSGQMDLLKVPNFEISLARFSINCIGFFGRDVAALGEKFCPANVDDEEWISAVLPSLLGRPGRVIGGLTVSHFSFFTQEDQLLQSRILDAYFDLAGVPPVPYVPIRKRTVRQRLRRALESRLLSGRQQYEIRARALSPYDGAISNSE